MREKQRYFVFVLISFVLMLNGCGGGGGSDGVGGGIAYTGITTQAAVESGNAQDLSTGAYEGGAMGASLSLGVVLQPAVGRPNYLDTALILEEVISQIDIKASLGFVPAGAIVNDSGTIPGQCGGNVQYSIQADDVTGDFSGTLNFSAFCSQGVLVAGGANITGKYDLQKDRFVYFSLASGSMSLTYGSDSVTAKMNISFNYQTSPATITMSIYLKNNKDGKVYWVDYSINLWKALNYMEVNASGKYYHPGYGYVVVSTPTNLRIYSGNDWPSQGVLILDGKTGSAGGSTRARLTVISSTTYQVEADTNGDGIYDWNSGILSWS